MEVSTCLLQVPGLCLFLTYLSQVTFLRKTRGSRLNIFAPLSDLSSLAKTGSEGSPLEAGPRNDIAVSGGQVLGDEWTTHVVEVFLLSNIDAVRVY
jgi:hypothetical protein